MHDDPGIALPLEATLPKTIKGLKRQATKLKKARGIRQTEALDIVAKSMGYGSYRSALNALGDDPQKPTQ